MCEYLDNVIFSDIYKTTYKIHLKFSRKCTDKVEECVDVSIGVIMGKLKLTKDKLLSERQARMLLGECEREAKNAIQNDDQKSKFITDYYIFNITYLTGLRVSEVINLKWSDIIEDVIIIRNSKGGKSRNVNVGKRTLKLLSDYKTLQDNLFKYNKDNDLVFRHTKGRQFTRYILHDRMKYWVKRLNFPDGISFHSLRHSAATRWLNNGVQLTTIKDQLGHTNITTTSEYLHVTESATEKIRSIS